MDDNYLMRKEGLTMTNENSVKHKSVAWAQSRIRATQWPWLPACLLGPSFPAWQEPNVLSKLCGTFGCQFWWSCPISWDCEMVSRLWAWWEMGWKNKRRKKIVRKEEQGKKGRNWWNKKRKKMLKKMDVLETSKKRSKCQQWGPDQKKKG